jgi:hypothetical protein
MWTPTTRQQHSRTATRYQTDLTDAEWRPRSRLHAAHRPIGQVLGSKEIERLAADVVNNSEDDDEYVIITKTGQKISQREIFMRSKVLIDSKGKTVDRDKAWNELFRFFSVLRESGAIEQ